MHDLVALMFDEPLTWLDPHGIRTLNETIRERAATGAAAVMRAFQAAVLALSRAAAVLSAAILVAMVGHILVEIVLKQHRYEDFQRFETAIRKVDEVVECYATGGGIDYLLKVVVPDIQGFDMVYKKLIQVVELFDVSSSFAMEELKYTTALPLDYA